MRLCYPSQLPYWVLHSTSLSMTTAFFFYLLKQLHPRVHYSLCSCCAPVIHNDCLCFLSLGLMIVVPSLLLNPVALSLRGSGIQFLVSAWIFHLSSSTRCDHILIANIREREKLAVSATQYLVLCCKNRVLVSETVLPHC